MDSTIRELTPRNESVSAVVTIRTAVPTTAIPTVRNVFPSVFYDAVSQEMSVYAETPQEAITQLYLVVLVGLNELTTSEAQAQLSVELNAMTSDINEFLRIQGLLCNYAI